MPDTRRQLEVLKPRQCGVGVPFAAELVGMGIQRLADGTLSAEVTNAWVQGQFDVSNAYNTIHRPAFLLGPGKRHLPLSTGWLGRTACQPL